MHDGDYTFIAAGPSDCSDNDAAHHISVAAISLNATGKCNIIRSSRSFLLQHAISTQSVKMWLLLFAYLYIWKVSAWLGCCIIMIGNFTSKKISQDDGKVT